MEKMRSNISMAVIRRLPKYYRYLNELMEKGVTRISSMEFGRSWDYRFADKTGPELFRRFRTAGLWVQRKGACG